MKHQINYYFLGLAVFLLAFGLLFLANLSAPASLQAFGNTNYYLFHQLVAFGIGLVLATATFKLPLTLIKKWAPILFFLNLALLAAVFLPAVGIKLWGASRWLGIGSATFQPSEFLKITSVLYLASWLSVRVSEKSRKSLVVRAKENHGDFIRTFIPYIVMLGAVMAMLFFQRDLGTMGIITAALMSAYFAIGTPLWHTLLAVGIEVIGGLVLIVTEPYRLQRFLTLLHPETDPLGGGFQLKQSILAIGSGGIFGEGWGMSTQKFGFLPQAMSDSVFAIIGEELGIVGCIIVITLFLAFFWQGIKIALQSSERFSKITSVGLMTWMIVQAFMNIASSVGLFPLTGIPLPFFSYGGSHLMSEMMAIGLLLNISKKG